MAFSLTIPVSRPKELDIIPNLYKLPIEELNVFLLCGIYFLCKEGIIQYIGQSTNIINRIFAHCNDKDKEFDSVYYISVSNKNQLRRIESELIAKFKPPLNKSGYNGSRINATPIELSNDNKIIDNPFAEIDRRFNRIEQLLLNIVNKEDATATESEEKLLTREETAELLKVDLSTLWHWTKKGKLKSHGLGNRVYYKRSEIENSLKPIN